MPFVWSPCIHLRLSEGSVLAHRYRRGGVGGAGAILACGLGQARRERVAARPVGCAGDPCAPRAAPLRTAHSACLRRHHGQGGIGIRGESRRQDAERLPKSHQGQDGDGEAQLGRRLQGRPGVPRWLHGEARASRLGAPVSLRTALAHVPLVPSQNIAMEDTEEYVNGQLKKRYGDCFVRGNNVLYISQL